MFNRTGNKKLKREFEEKVIEHIDSLYNMAFRMTQKGEDAEDLVQETTLKAYRNFSKFESGANFKA